MSQTEFKTLYEYETKIKCVWYLQQLVAYYNFTYLKRLHAVEFGRN